MVVNDAPWHASGRSFDVLAHELGNMVSSIKKAGDFVNVLIYCIPMLAPIRLCIEAGIFHRLTESEKPLGANDLASGLSTESGTGDEEERIDFIVRILRPLCALRMIDEVTSGVYQANELTRALADPGLAAGFKLVFDNSMGPASTLAQMVPYAMQNRYKAPPSAKDGPFQRARNIVGTSTFDHWVEKDPAQLSNLSRFMQRLQRERPHWTEWFPADALYPNEQHKGHDRFRFIDVGGGRGHDLLALAAKYPAHDVRFVLQDQSSVIDEVIEEQQRNGTELDSRVELSKHSFFEPQPFKTAEVYYMHKIMHDWPDVECVTILSQLRDAMGRDSKILVNDVILPSENCSLL